MLDRGRPALESISDTGLISILPHDRYHPSFPIAEAIKSISPLLLGNMKFA
jgi:hypothetical protein